MLSGRPDRRPVPHEESDLDLTLHPSDPAAADDTAAGSQVARPPDGGRRR
jgi:hypothetical protein